jgi:hypothetical protein
VLQTERGGMVLTLKPEGCSVEPIPYLKANLERGGVVLTFKPESLNIKPTPYLRALPDWSSDPGVRSNNSNQIMIVIIQA